MESIEKNQMEISKRLEEIMEGNKVVRSEGYSDFLYDPRGFHQKNDVGQPSIESFPKLLAVGTDDHFENHHSYEIAKALNGYAIKMGKVEEEYKQNHKSGKTLYKGKESEKIAKAIQEYSKQHKHQGLPENFHKPSSSNSIVALSSGMAAISAVPVTMIDSTMQVTDYSWATLLKSMNWACVIYTIVWICSGLLLVFFGYSSFFWLHKLGLSRGTTSSTNLKSVGKEGILEKLANTFSPANERIQRNSIDSSASAAAKRRKQKRKRPILSGGIGGILIGFLFFSYLTAIITNTVCINEQKDHLSAGSYFAIWLGPGLLGAIIGGHFYMVAKLMTGILGGTTVTIILTAIFGIRTILVRAILLSIFCCFFTIPLLLPTSKFRFVQMIILNGCTSMIGMVTFLNGVALVAPSVQPSSNWLDLWTILFMNNSIQSDSTKSTILESAWHTSTFKGYIAGAVLGSVFGFIFEFIFHRNCGQDPESEWNQYLGNYTQHIESGVGVNPTNSNALYDDPKFINSPASLLNNGGGSARAGMFEPAPNAWQKMVDFFDSDRARPAHYGGLSGDGTIVENGTIINEKIQKKRSVRTGGGGPARFSRLSKRDEDDDDFNSDSSDDEKERLNDDDEDDDDDKTDVGSDGEEKRRASKSAIAHVQMMNYGGYSLPRPSVLTNAQSSSSFTNTIESRLSGTTVAASASSGSSSSSNDKVHKSINIYRDSMTQPSKPSETNHSSPSNTTLPATPSLINAISRIQLAQQQARAWQQQHENQGAPYSSSKDSKGEKKLNAKK